MKSGPAPVSIALFTLAWVGATQSTLAVVAYAVAIFAIVMGLAGYCQASAGCGLNPRHHAQKHARKAARD
ncbi:MAG: hypothetical protein ACRDFX_08520 [Chloroflexota bacterium]